MSAVLGISALYHDAAAALVVDGRVVAAMQEERFSRNKNDARVPRLAALACLAKAGLVADDLDEIVFYENPYAKLERVLLSLLRVFPRAGGQFSRAVGAQLGDKIWVLDAIADALDVDRAKVTFGDHHASHAASAFFTSPFERAAVLTVDGVGEEASTSIFRGEGDALDLVESIAFPQSLGLLYAALTAYLGFEVNEGEYKVMGLAAFGAPRYRDELARVVRLHDDGSFDLDLDYFAFTTETELGFSSALERLLGPRRSPSAPWALEGHEDRRYADIAATLQAITEEALVGLAKRARKQTGADALCLAGGVALNAVANARLLREAGFSRVFVHPAAGDAGGALGAAILASMRRGDGRPPPLDGADLGATIDRDEAKSLADALGLATRSTDRPAEAIADAIERGKIVAVARGGFEWGPRALGHRSLLAPPSDPKIKERLNRAIKHREPFRPFAPAVLASRAAELFDGAPNDMTPFMTTVCPVAASARGALEAAQHVDGSARVQTVREGDALFDVLTSLERRGLPPVVLNTSLNGAREPICASATDVLGFLLAHPIEQLFVDDLIIERERGAA